MRDGGPDTTDSRVLVLAPTARDAAATRDLLAAAGVAAVVCASVEDVCDAAARGAGAGIVTAEAVLADTAGRLAALLRAQPPWSQLPLIVLAPAGAESPKLLRALEAVGPMTLMPRPVQVSTLVSAVKAALRDRARQYAVRDLLDERERAAAALHGERAQAAAILESITDGFLAIDRDWTFTYVNGAAGRLLSCAPGDLLGKNLWEAYPGQVGTGFERMHRRVAAGGPAESRTEYYPDHDRWYEGHTYPAPDGITIYFRDVSGQKRAEAERERLTAEAARQARLFDTTLSSISDFAYVLDRGARFRYVNKPLLDLWGLALDQAVGKDFFGLNYPPDLAAQLARQVSEVFDTRRPLTDQTPYTSPTGVYGYYEYIFSPVFAADGAVEAIAGTTRNITKQKEAEAALRRIADASRAINSVLSADSIIRIATMEARALVGAHVAAASLLSPDDPASALHTLALSAKHGYFRPADDNVPAASLHPLVENATAPVRLTRAELLAHPLYHAIGKGVMGWPPPAGWLAVPLVGYSGKTMGFLQLSDKEGGEFTADDEAALVQLAAVAAAGIENARLYERLKEQDKRKDEFLATLAHELRNPLAPVRNGLQIFRMTPLANPALDQVREMMERQVTHLVHLVDDLLDVSRVTSGKIVLKMERVELGAVVAAAVETSRPLVEAAGHTLTVELPAAPVTVTADPHRLAQVLTNLINNSAKYTPAGGAIRVRAGRDGADAVLSVHDTGVGLPAEMLPKIFDMFTQVGGSLERSQGGLGIGLTLVRKLAEMHGGTVTAESPGAGQGSTFTVRLPLSRGEGPGIRGEDNPPSSSPLTPDPSPLKVLVVDDNVDGAESLAMLLTIGGHTAKTAHTGPAGLAAVKAFRPDVVFLDIGLPGMNGYEVAKHIRDDPALGARVALVALTGWGTDDDRQRATAAGFDHHLTKPAEAERVTALLAKLAPRARA